jgi:hypothetical protein
MVAGAGPASLSCYMPAVWRSSLLSVAPAGRCGRWRWVIRLHLAMSALLVVYADRDVVHLEQHQRVHQRGHFRLRFENDALLERSPTR